MKILIVDDETAILGVCERALRGAGHEVASCLSAEEAVPRLGESWDLVVTDVSLPGKIDGNELAHRAREAGIGNVALMTGNPSLESSIAAMKDGACDYLLKPFKLEDLLKLTKRCEFRPRQTAALAPRKLMRATILFADIRGFTTFAECTAPEEVADRLDELLACVISAVDAEGGSVQQFTGDGAMAVFGVPHSLVDPAGAAARAALRARDAVEKLGTLQFGFGINTGEVAAGRVGTAEHEEFGIVGSSVNAAARIQTAAGPGQILVGPETAGLLRRHFALGDPRTIRLKGLNEAMIVQELLHA